MEPQEFKRQLDELRTVISDGIAYFSAWRGLMVEDDDSAQALNRYRAFFLPARNAMLWMALLQFSKVFDPDRKTVSLRNLLTAAGKSRARLVPEATEEELNEIREQLDTNGATDSNTDSWILIDFFFNRLIHIDPSSPSMASRTPVPHPESLRLGGCVVKQNGLLPTYRAAFPPDHALPA